MRSRDENYSKASMTNPLLRVARFPERTVAALFWRSAQQHPERNFLRILEPQSERLVERPVTYDDFAQQVRAATACLRSRGVAPRDDVLLLAENSDHWQVFAMAATWLGARPVAAYSNLSAEAVRDIARRTRPRAVVVSTQEQFDKLGSTAPRLVLSRDALRGVNSSKEMVRWKEALETTPLSKREAANCVAQVQASSTFLLIFTSGTSGRHKGVPVLQGAFVRALENFAACTEMREHDLGLMFLPFAHIAGQAQFHLAHATGHSLLMVSRREDILPAFGRSPTYTLSVPLIYSRIVEQAHAGISSRPAPVRKLLDSAMQAAARVRCDGSKSLSDRALTALFDQTVGAAVKRKLGGNVRALFAGGASTPPHVWRFFESLSVPYVSAYGMSETASMIVTNALSLPRRADSAGYLSPDVELRIADDGEIRVRGPLVFSSYLEATDQTEAFTSDGYFRTGDLGQMHPEGYLQLIGRKRELIALSTGKKIAPGPLEERIASSPPISAAVIVGDGRAFASAVVFVAEEHLPELGPDDETRSVRLLDLVQSRVAGASTYEIPKRVTWIVGTPADFPGLLTPSFKLRRNVFFERFSELVERLYESSGPNDRRPTAPPTALHG